MHILISFPPRDLLIWRGRQRQGDANASQAPKQELVHTLSHRDAALYLQQARGRRDYLPPEPGQQPVQGQDAGTKPCTGINLPPPHQPGQREAKGGQEFLTMG